jgi:PAS domain S-box-containing protein
MERTILIVEDSPTQAERLRFLLEQSGYHVDVARNGREALDRVRLSPPDLIISDVVMPEMDGYALCRAVKAGKATRRTPFVLLTERRTPLDIIQGLEMGADNFITKPFEDDYLLERVGRIFQQLDLRRLGQLEIEVAVRVGHRDLTISADKQQVIELLFATFEELARTNTRLIDSQRVVEEYARTLEHKVEERTRELRSLFDGVPVGLFRTAPDGQILDANRAFLQILGFRDRAEALAANVTELYLDADARDRWQALADAHGVAHDIELRVRRRDGSVAWVRHSVKALRDRQERLLGYEGALEDITARHRAEEETRLLQTLTRGVRDSDTVDKVFSVVIRRICEATGWALGEVWVPSADQAALELGPAWHGATPGAAGFRAASQELRFARGAGIPGRVWATREPEWHPDLARADGFIRADAAREAGLRAAVAIPVPGTAAPLAVMAFYAAEVRALDARLMQLVSAAVGQLGPVIERKRAEEALRHSEKLASMGYLLAGVAHELNNPLSVVIGQTALLAHLSAGDAAVLERTKKIADAAERCARIVKNFLGLARQRPPERRALDLNQAIRCGLELLAYQLRVENVEVVLDLAEDLPPIQGDGQQLDQVLVNLVTNAWQAMRRSPEPRRLTLGTRHDRARGCLELRVADTGPGIPPDIQPRIFEPFFTTKPLGEGTGLGLPLTRTFIEEHGGSIRVVSAPGQGATFVIELPTTAGPDAGSARAADEAVRPTRPRTILVVDDEHEIAALLADILTAAGHQVDAVGDGQAALERLRQRPYDLILSDLRMPRLDGPGLYRALEREHPELLSRFVLITGDALGTEATAFVQEVSVPSVSKPFSFEGVLRVVDQVT